MKDFVWFVWGLLEGLRSGRFFWVLKGLFLYRDIFFGRTGRFEMLRLWMGCSDGLYKLDLKTGFLA